VALGALYRQILAKKKKRDKNGGFFFHWVRARVLLLNPWLCRGQGRGLYAKTVA